MTEVDGPQVGIGGLVGFTYGTIHDSSGNTLQLNHFIVPIAFFKNRTDVSYITVTQSFGSTPQGPHTNTTGPILVGGQNVGTVAPYVGYGDNVDLSSAPSTATNATLVTSGKLSQAVTKLYGQGGGVLTLMLVENPTKTSQKFSVFDSLGFTLLQTGQNWDINILPKGYFGNLNGYVAIPLVQVPYNQNFWLSVYGPEDSTTHQGILNYYIYTVPISALTYQNGTISVTEFDSNNNVIDTGSTGWVIYFYNINVSNSLV